MELNDDQLATVLQATRDFAKEMLEELGLFTPFGARGLASGEIEFFAPTPKQENTPIGDLFREVEAALVESARNGEIVAAVIAANVMLPDDIESPFRNAIGLHIEARGHCRFVYSTYELSPAASGKSSVKLGKMIPVEVAPSIFVH